MFGPQQAYFGVSDRVDAADTVASPSVESVESSSINTPPTSTVTKAAETTPEATETTPKLEATISKVEDTTPKAQGPSPKAEETNLKAAKTANPSAAPVTNQKVVALTADEKKILDEHNSFRAKYGKFHVDVARVESS
jgi:uncharacterized protein YkwD